MASRGNRKNLRPTPAFRLNRAAPARQGAIIARPQKGCARVREVACYWAGIVDLRECYERGGLTADDAHKSKTANRIRSIGRLLAFVLELHCFQKSREEQSRMFLKECGHVCQHCAISAGCAMCVDRCGNA
jgi:hypothetical protein